MTTHSDHKSGLSQEELEFIHQLFTETTFDFELLPLNAREEVFDHEPRLLELLQLANDLRLEARFGNYTLQFSPSIETRPQDGRRHLHLGYPLIIEHNGQERSLRVGTNSEDILIVDESGQLEKAEVSDISATGIALTAESVNRDVVPGKSRLRFRVRFPDKRWFSCEGSVVRMERTDNRPMLALRFTRLSRQMQEELTSYLYHHTPNITQ